MLDCCENDQGIKQNCSDCKRSIMHRFPSHDNLGGLRRLEYYKQKNSSFSRVFEFKWLFDIFTDPTNPTPEELTLFNLEYGVPWITELRQEDLVRLF